jgi:GTP pyrophosphokinase
MRKRGKAVDEIYDLLALRIICNDSAACYALIGIVHTLWKPMEGRFKDYIAMPKTNGYQSLHTTVMCEGFPLEIQIRTQEMHSVAEHGVASHWLYKKGKSKDSVSVENLSIINQLKALRAENKNDAELFAEIKDELLGDSIYVFTPQGDVRELPAGATAIDFAYSIHSRIGETIVGAKADGNIIPLSSPLKNTQIIEILTNPQSHPTENQLHSVKTSKARNKIRSWLLQNGAIINTQGTGTASALVQNSQKNATQDLSDKPLDKTVAGAEEEPIRIRIGDTTNFMVKSAKCCNPVFGDEIIGYVSRGRGLIIHRTGCENFLRIPNVEERSVSVIWEQKPIVVKGKKK